MGICDMVEHRNQSLPNPGLQPDGPPCSLLRVGENATHVLELLPGLLDAPLQLLPPPVLLVVTERLRPRDRPRVPLHR